MGNCGAKPDADSSPHKYSSNQPTSAENGQRSHSVGPDSSAAIIAVNVVTSPRDTLPSASTDVMEPVTKQENNSVSTLPAALPQQRPSSVSDIREVIDLPQASVDAAVKPGDTQLSNGHSHGQADTRPQLSQAKSRPRAGSSPDNSTTGSMHSSGSHTSTSTSQNPVSTWDKAKMLFTLMRAEELLNDLHDLKYIGAGGYGKVFKAVWRSAPVAVKLVPSHSSELFKSSSYKEALLCKELCHPNIVQTYETRCAQLTDDFVHLILAATETPLAQIQGLAGASGVPVPGAPQTYGSQEFVSGDGFGLPSPVPDVMVRGRTLPEAAAKWKDILFTTGAKAGDFLTVIIMDFCDYGSLVRPIVKGMFRPFSASGNDREARVRYRALLRTAKEIAQGLEHLHHLKVVHGDLKPGNVLLKGSRVDVRGFNAQVIDFGLSHMVQNSDPQKVSKAGGTLVYAAPEVFSGRVGKAADVYSLGIILWEMVTGSQPYKDLAEGQIVLGVQKGGLRPAWPAGQFMQLQELYERCVAQIPESRPKAKEVVQYLTQIEMDLRAELRAAHKQMQQAQMLSAAAQQSNTLQQQQEKAALQQQAATALQQHADKLKQAPQRIVPQAPQLPAVARAQ